jgi:hypothetical protein
MFLTLNLDTEYENVWRHRYGIPAGYLVAASVLNAKYMAFSHYVSFGLILLSFGSSVCKNSDFLGFQMPILDNCYFCL